MNWHSDFAPAPSQYLNANNYIKVSTDQSSIQNGQFYNQNIKLPQSHAIIYQNNNLSLNLNQTPSQYQFLNRPQYHQSVVYNQQQSIYSPGYSAPIHYTPSFQSQNSSSTPRGVSYSVPSPSVVSHNLPLVAMNNKLNESSAKSLVPLIIESLKRQEIKMVAFDFDCTIVNIHTGGQWIDSAEKLAEFVRPCFRELLPALLKCDDMFVCVVTFSPQEELIREVLRFCMKEEHSVTDLVNKIVIQGNTRDLIEEHGIGTCYSSGKQIHLKICRDHFESVIRKTSKETGTSWSKIRNESILLIDDDLQNVQMALENGHAAFLVNNSMQLNEFYQYLCDV